MLIDFHSHKPQKNQEEISILSLRYHQFPSDESSYYTAGIHPWDLKEIDDIETALSTTEGKLSKVIGMGECGIDLAIETPIELQRKVFCSQLEMADKHRLPFVVIHCVRAFHEVLEIIKNSGFKGTYVFHDYNGSLEITRELLNKNCLFSYGDKLFKENTKGHKSLKIIPLERLLFETDDMPIGIRDCYQKYVNLYPDVDFDQLVATIHTSFKNLIDKTP